MSDIGLQVIAFLIGLGPLVLLHEIGHFVFARRAGIRVLEFGIGFPPRARKLWRGMGRLRVGSEWVRTRRNFEYPAGLADGAIVEARAVEENGHLMLRSVKIVDPDQAGAVTTPLKTLAADGVRLRGEVSRFDPGTLYSLNWLPIGGFARMLGEEDPSSPDSFAAAPKRHRAATLLAGPGMNVVAALVIFTLAYMLGQPVVDKVEVVVTGVVAGAPAEQAGVEAGMAVLAVDDVAVNDSLESLTEYTREHVGRNITLTVRDAEGGVRELNLVPRTQWPTNEGPMGISIGARAASHMIVHYSLPESAGKALNAVVDVLDGMITLPRQLLAGEIDPNLARPVGPAGIAQISAYALEASVEQQVLFPILNMAGVISVALAFTNLLPLPALDGGRLVFILIEAVRGKRVSPEKEAMVHFAGMMFLLALFVLITIQDVSNPIPNPF
jgi:regulator of sigma E protease